MVGTVHADGPVCQAKVRFVDGELPKQVRIGTGQSLSVAKVEGTSPIDSHSASLSEIDIAGGALKIRRLESHSIARVVDGKPVLDQGLVLDGVTVQGQEAAITEKGVVFLGQGGPKAGDMRQQGKPLESVDLGNGLVLSAHLLPDYRRVDDENELAEGQIRGVEIKLGWPRVPNAPLINTAESVGFRLGAARSHVQQFSLTNDGANGSSGTDAGSHDGVGAAGGQTSAATVHREEAVCSTRPRRTCR